MRTKSQTIRRVAILSVGLICAGAVEANTNKEAQVGTPKISRVLFMGNSITRHGPKADIGWTNNWGMAASALEKDYVHLLVSRIAQVTGKAPAFMIDQIAGFEQTYKTANTAPIIARCREFKPDVVVLAIAENVPDVSAEADRVKFRSVIDGLLKDIKGCGDPAVFVRSSFWAETIRDSILREAAKAAGVGFVDISGISHDESNYARSERKFQDGGVAAHPGDKGMQAIADALWKAISDKAGLAP